MKRLFVALFIGVLFFACKKDDITVPVVLIDNKDTIKIDSLPIIEKIDSLYKARLQGAWYLSKYFVGFSSSIKVFNDGMFIWEFDSVGNTLNITSDSNYAVIDTGKFSFALDINGVCNGTVRLLYKNGENLGTISFDSTFNKMVVTGECYDGPRFELIRMTAPKWYYVQKAEKTKQMTHLEPIKDITSSPIDFSNLQVGQKLVYLNYSYHCDDFTNDGFKYLGDTMVLEVVEIDNQLHFKESFTRSSSQVQFIGVDTRVPLYPVKFQNSKLLFNNFRSLSGLFYFYGNDTLHLQPTHNAIATQTNCNVSLNSTVFVGNEIATIASFKIDDFEIKDKTIVSCVPQVIQINNGYLIYDSNKLYASQVYTFEGVSGWVLIDKYR